LSYICLYTQNSQNSKLYSFEKIKKKSEPTDKELKYFLRQKKVTRLSEIWVWDPASDIRDPERTYLGSGSKRHRIPDPNHQQRRKLLKREKKFTTWGLKSVFFCSVVRMVLIQPAAAARLRSNPDIIIG
jgi:hypothetical protein